ncbi:PREDICTED: uncharacterized protein LOC108772092 [Cyphomyrmex costatus]|uniref:uncharacterized protein LOC108772092 n=1 Tax=Cyphomyrmex costatus TaxID=456900 RepID=UPI0008522FA9|nr:PREDICTED: uncharacterized protein LOC108772092 [Cyphomyrmex costatus]
MDNISIPSNNYTIEENICERHFLDNTSQDSQGRYIVKLPVKEQMLEKIGDSRETALKRLREIEKRFKRNPALKIRYTKFIKEYKSLGHIRRLEPPIAEEPTSFYLPHHCVFKAVGQTSKIRVVFDASCRSSSGVSLNDALLVGPNVQRDLVSILLRFRFFSCVITADITKMYRQISMHPSQTRLQRILWRNDSSMNVNTYELTTITYGTASASFLATRCLKHLADQYTHQLPRGSACVLRDFYVDDMLTGADSIDELKLIRDETIQLLRAGMFELSKWASNCPELLETDKRGREPVAIWRHDNITDSCILGMQWNHCQDTFQFSCEPDSEIGIVSKRLMLSKVSKYFDPLGLLGPVIVVAKLILQDLWQLDIQWDESVPQEIHTRWVTFKTQMKALNQLTISRCVKSNIHPLVLEIHRFCDASQRAFGTCIYLRTKLGHNEYRSTLLCSRSRVAPFKAISLPRLELSAALLLAQLIDKVKNSLEFSQWPIYLWLDSTIALNWISSPSRQWSTFVGNRVGEIQRLTEIEHWRHIASPNNPADILSRGLNPFDLVNTEKWWSGLEFLKWDEEHWSPSVFVRLESDLPERKEVRVAVSISHPCIVRDLLNKYSNLSKICRIIAYCLRFSKLHRAYAVSDFVSHDEISIALNYICRSIQRQTFHS